MEIQSPQENKVSFNRLYDSKSLRITQIRCDDCDFIIPLFGCSKCDECDKVFCKDHSKANEDCECGRRKNSPDDEFYSELKKIKISCKYKSKGCKISSEYNNLTFHEIDCLLSPIPNCSYCNEPLFREEKTNHLSSCPEIEIICPKCEFTSKRKNHHHYCDVENFFKLFIKFSLEEKLNLLNELIKKIDLVQDISILNINNVNSLIISENSIFKEISKAKSKNNYFIHF